MQKLFLTASVVVILLLSSFAQRVEPVSALADVVLQLGTEGDGRQFPLGELIPVKFSYSAKTPCRYVWVGNSTRLAQSASNPTQRHLTS